MQLGNRDRENLPVEPRLFGQPAHSRSALVVPISAARWLLVLILLCGVYFFHGFLVPVLAAVVIGFASWPIYWRLLQGLNGNRTLAATIAIISVVAFIVVPISLAAIYAVEEVRDWLVWAVATNANGAPAPAWLATIPAVGAWLGEQWVKYVGHPGALGELVQLVSGSNIGNI
ncbi:AI-2E family transporter, partial [Sinorhizobium meliloti]